MSISSTGSIQNKSTTAADIGSEHLHAKRDEDALNASGISVEKVKAKKRAGLVSHFLEEVQKMPQIASSYDPTIAGLLANQSIMFQLGVVMSALSDLTRNSAQITNLGMANALKEALAVIQKIYEANVSAANSRFSAAMWQMVGQIASGVFSMGNAMKTASISDRPNANALSNKYSAITNGLTSAVTAGTDYAAASDNKDAALADADASKLQSMLAMIMDNVHQMDAGTTGSLSSNQTYISNILSAIGSIYSSMSR